MAADPQLSDILRDLKEKPTVPVWPHAGKLLGISKSQAYAAAKDGEIEIIRIGRCIRAVSIVLRKRLGLDEAA